MTSDLGIDNRCQFSNEMSQSQLPCHKDVTYDTVLRLLRGFQGQTAVFSDLARPAHIWSDGALVVRPPPRDLFVQVLGGSTVCAAHLLVRG
jgi:hypothetical protein